MLYFGAQPGAEAFYEKNGFEALDTRILLFNQDIRDAISAGVRRDKLRELVYQSDVNTMLEDGLEKVLMGLTTVEEVLKLIELEDDEKGSKAYGLKSAINNTVLANTNVNAGEFGMNNYSEIKQNDNPKQFEQATSSQITYQDPSSQQTSSNINQVPNVQQTPVVNPQQPMPMQTNQQQTMPQTLNDLINKAN